MALDNFSIQVQQGQAYALLGPNGAGKTTFVKCLLGLVSCDSGELSILNEPTSSHLSRRRLAYLPEKFSFHQFYTVQGVLEFYAQMRGVEKDRLEGDIETALKQVKILELRHKKVRELSKGQLQRVGIASLLIGSPELLILDEPFSGIDPLGIKDLKGILNGLKQKGVTLFINSHILSEMEKICESMAILNQGKCLVSGNIKDLLRGKSLEDYFYNLVEESNSHS